MSGNALIIDFTATVVCKFPELQDLDGGSLYIEALDFGDIAICADFERSGLKSSEKKLLKADMWEAELMYLYYADGDRWFVTIEGGMAAEILEDADLQTLVSSETTLENVIISWAEDGDSPKVVGQETELKEADVSNVEINDAFEEYP